MTHELYLTLALSLGMFLAGILTQKGANAWEVHLLTKQLEETLRELDEQKGNLKAENDLHKERIKQLNKIIGDLTSKLQNKTFHCQPIQKHEDNIKWRELDFPNKGDRK